jgi:hypothetical protein
VRQRQEVPHGDGHYRVVVGAVIGLCDLRCDRQDDDAQRRERGNGQRRFSPESAGTRATSSLGGDPICSRVARARISMFLHQGREDDAS